MAASDFPPLKESPCFVLGTYVHSLCHIAKLMVLQIQFILLITVILEGCQGVG
jgi:hypothetical protein